MAAAGVDVPYQCCVVVKHNIRASSEEECKMLTLKRRAGETIVINESITIYVDRTGSGSCSLSIEADDADFIRRGEIAPDAEKMIQRARMGLEVPAA